MEKIESELAQLVKRRATLAEKLAAATTALEAARAERSRLLIEEEDGDSVEMDRIIARIAAAERDAGALRDAITEIDNRIPAARKRLTDARDAEERAAAAERRETSARNLDKAAAKIEQLVKSLAAELDGFAKAIDPAHVETRIYVHLFGPAEKTLTNYEITRACLAEALFAAFPEAFEVAGRQFDTHVLAKIPLAARIGDGLICEDIERNNDSVKFLPFSGSVKSNLTDAMRSTAAQIRDGSRSVPDAERAPDPDAASKAPKVFEHVNVIFLAPVRYADADGKIVVQADDRADVPRPVADAAIRCGLATGPDDERGEDHIEWRLRRGARHRLIPTEGETIVDLAVNWEAA